MSSQDDAVPPSHPLRPALDELVDIGMVLARSVAARTNAGTVSDRAFVDLARAYDLIAAAIRRTILLAVRIDEGTTAPRPIQAPSPTPAQPPPPREPGREPGPERAGCLDRLEDETIDGRPPEEIIAGIVRDLREAACIAAASTEPAATSQRPRQTKQAAPTLEYLPAGGPDQPPKNQSRVGRLGNTKLE